MRPSKPPIRPERKTNSDSAVVLDVKNLVQRKKLFTEGFQVGKFEGNETLKKVCSEELKKLEQLTYSQQGMKSTKFEQAIQELKSEGASQVQENDDEDDFDKWLARRRIISTSIRVYKNLMILGAKEDNLEFAKVGFEGLKELQEKGIMKSDEDNDDDDDEIGELKAFFESIVRIASKNGSLEVVVYLLDPSMLSFTDGKGSVIKVTSKVEVTKALLMGALTGKHLAKLNRTLDKSLSDLNSEERVKVVEANLSIISNIVNEVRLGGIIQSNCYPAININKYLRLVKEIMPDKMAEVMVDHVVPAFRHLDKSARIDIIFKLDKVEDKKVLRIALYKAKLLSLEDINNVVGQESKEDKPSVNQEISTKIDSLYRTAFNSFSRNLKFYAGTFFSLAIGVLAVGVYEEGKKIKDYFSTYNALLFTTAITTTLSATCLCAYYFTAVRGIEARKVYDAEGIVGTLKTLCGRINTVPQQGTLQTI